MNISTKISNFGNDLNNLKNDPKNTLLQKKRKMSNNEKDMELSNKAHLPDKNIENKKMDDKMKENMIIDTNGKDKDMGKEKNNNKKQNLSDTEIIELNSNTENKNNGKKTEDNNNINKQENENKENEIKKDNINMEKNKLEENNNNNNELINNINKEDNLDNNSLSNLSISLKSKEKMNKNEKLKNLYTYNGLLNDKNIIFRDNLGYEFDIQVCGLRIQMGPFLSDRKARSVIKFINHSKYIINSISYVAKKEWFKNLSQMIEELTE